MNIDFEVKNYDRINRGFIEIIMKDCMYLIDKYNLCKYKKDGRVLIRKRVRSRYWHIMYSHYCELVNFMTKREIFGYDKEDNEMDSILFLLIKVIPLLIDIKVVKKNDRLNRFECIWYDYFV